MGDKRIVDNNSVYNLPTSNLDFMRTRGEKYETHPHPTGQRWGDKVR